MENSTSLRNEITTLTDQIKTTEEKMRSLDREKMELIAKGDGDGAVQASRDREPLKATIDELEIRRAAAEARLQKLRENEPAAAAIRKQIVEELWPKGIKALTALQKCWEGLPEHVKTLDEVNQKIQALAKKHFELLGDTLPIPQIGPT